MYVIYVPILGCECDVLSYETWCFTVQILLSLNPEECNEQWALSV